MYTDGLGHDRLEQLFGTGATSNSLNRERMGFQSPQPTRHVIMSHQLVEAHSQV